MNPGDRIREVGTGRLGFALHQSNMRNDEFLARFDGNDYNTIAYEGSFEVLPSEPFRPDSAPPVVKVHYHISRWPYEDSVIDRRSTMLHEFPARWTPPTDGFVDEITVR